MNKKAFYKNLKNFLLSLNRVIARRGPYRFVIKNWDRIEDINLVESIMKTDFFKDTIEPQPLPIDKFSRFLVLAPHQDDETIGAGGLMLYLKELNKQLDVVFMTDGAQDIEGFTTQEVVDMRNKEAKEALRPTGARIRSIPISNMRIDVKEEHLGQLSMIISETKPEVILLPWFLDTPVKHRVTNHLLFLANKDNPINPKLEIWSYQVHNSIYPNAYLDITSKVQSKREMLKVYRSQNDNFINYDHLTLGMNAWNSRFLKYKPQDVKPQYIELYFTLPIIDYLELIDRFYMSNLEEVYKGRNDLIGVMKSLNNVYFN